MSTLFWFIHRGKSNPIRRSNCGFFPVCANEQRNSASLYWTGWRDLELKFLAELIFILGSFHLIWPYPPCLWPTSQGVEEIRRSRRPCPLPEVLPLNRFKLFWALPCSILFCQFSNWYNKRNWDKIYISLLPFMLCLMLEGTLVGKRDLEWIGCRKFAVWAMYVVLCSSVTCKSHSADQSSTLIRKEYAVESFTMKCNNFVWDFLLELFSISVYYCRFCKTFISCTDCPVHC